jgi:formate hydrogenlyase subunit 3/multisubunit Na+/H+ antiporter MnhD subunit
MVSPVFFVALPLAAAFLMVLFGNRGTAKTIAIIATGGLLLLALSWLQPALGAPVTMKLGGVEAPLGIALVLDELGVGLAVLVAVSLFLVTVYSLGYLPAGAGAHAAATATAGGGSGAGRGIRGDAQELRYYAVLMLLGAASFGLILTRDLFNLFVFYEVLCISSYILVAYEQDDRALEASLKYMILGTVGSLLMLIAIGLSYRLAGSLAMEDVAVALAAAPGPYATLVAILFLFGMGLEAAIFPVNAWLPDAHSSAPSSISAVLSGFVIELALVVLLRIGFTVFASVDLLVLLRVLAIAGVFVGEIAAWSQRELKRTLAYSSIGQVGIMLFAFSLGTEAGRQAALGHLYMHAGAKSVLFLVAGYFILRTGSHLVAAYRGIARRMPVSSVLFALAALSLLGVPPLLGFFTKFRIVAAAAGAASAASASLAWLGVGAILFGTLLEGAYLFRIVRTLFDRPLEATAADDAGRGAGEMDVPALAATALFAVILVFGAAALPFMDGLLVPAATALAGLF